jgi:hypothetical protein
MNRGKWLGEPTEEMYEATEPSQLPTANVNCHLFAPKTTLAGAARYCNFLLIPEIIPVCASMQSDVMARDPFPNLSSKQLRAVLAVANYRSLIAAATSLKMSQPAMTRMIKHVEAELGVPLFVRNTRGK